MEQPYKKRLWQFMDWKKVEHSKNRIKLAGNAISKNDYSEISENEARIIVNNWRASHAFPLQVFYVNCKNKAKQYPNAIGVQRLKRLESIVSKLERQPNMSIVRMQDLGGCRLIMDSVSDVYKIVHDFKKSRIRHELIRETDYIQTPKESGYRCVHLVYKYNSDKKNDYNGMLIEIQVRTKLQHLWATAIEVLGLYTKYNLKASQGDIRILRYMELVSALFTMEENTPLSKTVPTTREEILNELKNLNDVNVLHILSAVRVALEKKDKYSDGNREGYYILSIDHSLNRLLILYFKKSDIDNATKAYEDIEKNNIDGTTDSVLVSAASMDTLKKAYPNYFTDVSQFVATVENIISVK